MFQAHTSGAHERVAGPSRLTRTDIPMLVADEDDDEFLDTTDNVRRSGRTTKPRQTDDFVRSDTIRMVGERIGEASPYKKKRGP